MNFHEVLRLSIGFIILLGCESKKSHIFKKENETSYQKSGISSKFKNIVLILADDLGWSDLGYANGEAITPNIDKLAREGIILDKFYTYALCTPSRSSILSGVFAEKTGLQHSVIEQPSPFGLPQNFELMPKHFKNQGYMTHMVGKWHLGSCNMKYTPVNRGFDTFYGFFDALENYYTHRVDYNVSNSLFSGLDSWNQTTEYLLPILNKNNTFAQFMYDERAVEIITAHDKSKPLFLYYAAQTPHADHEFNCPKKYTDLYPNVTDPMRQKLLGLVSILDESIGNLTKALKDNDLIDNTLIYFLSDNGGEVKYSGRNFPLRGGKRTVFEGGHRVRAFINGKGLKPFQYNGIFHSVDLLPTIMSSALSMPVEFSGIDGVNQWDVITKNLDSRRKAFIYNIDPVGNLGCSKLTEAVRDGDWKLIKGCPGIYTDWYNLTEFDLTKYQEFNGINMSISYENPTCVDKTKPAISAYFLFNIKDDPFEKINLAEQFPCKVRDLETKISNYKTQSVPPYITEPPFYDPKSNPANFGDKWSPGWC